MGGRREAELRSYWLVREREKRERAEAPARAERETREFYQWLKAVEPPPSSYWDWLPAELQNHVLRLRKDALVERTPLLDRVARRTYRERGLPGYKRQGLLRYTGDWAVVFHGWDLFASPVHPGKSSDSRRLRHEYMQVDDQRPASLFLDWSHELSRAPGIRSWLSGGRPRPFHYSGPNAIRGLTSDVGACWELFPLYDFHAYEVPRSLRIRDPSRQTADWDRPVWMGTVVLQSLDLAVTSYEYSGQQEARAYHWGTGSLWLCARTGELVYLSDHDWVCQCTGCRHAMIKDRSLVGPYVGVENEHQKWCHLTRLSDAHHPSR